MIASSVDESASLTDHHQQQLPPLALVAPNGAVLAANAQFSFICGISVDVLLASNIMSLIHFPHPQLAMRSYYALHALSQSDPNRQLEFRAPAGKIHQLLSLYRYDLVITLSSNRLSGCVVLEATFERGAPITPLLLQGGTAAAAAASSAASDYAVHPATLTAETSAAVCTMAGTQYLPQQQPNLILLDPRRMESLLSNYHTAAVAALRSVNLVRPKRILIVDDASSTLKVMARMISRLGQEVHTATNGREALDMLLKHRYDLVVMDIFMPTMNGIQASSQYRLFEQSNDVNVDRQRIIAISGEKSEDIENQIDRAGFDGFVQKPLTQETFRKLMISLTDGTTAGAAVADAAVATASSSSSGSSNINNGFPLIASPSFVAAAAFASLQTAGDEAHVLSVDGDEDEDDSSSRSENDDDDDDNDDDDDDDDNDTITTTVTISTAGTRSASSVSLHALEATEATDVTADGMADTAVNAAAIVVGCSSSGSFAPNHLPYSASYSVAQQFGTAATTATSTAATAESPQGQGSRKRKSNGLAAHRYCETTDETEAATCEAAVTTAAITTTSGTPSSVVETATSTSNNQQRRVRRRLSESDATNQMSSEATVDPHCID